MLAGTAPLFAEVNDPSKNRVLSLVRPATGESLRVTYWRGEWYNAAALNDLAIFFRDPRQGSTVDIDPALLDFLYAIISGLDYEGRVVVFDGVLDEATLAQRRSSGSEYDLALERLHEFGRAVDFTLPDIPMETVRDLAVKLNLGGVGYLPAQAMIHIDTGETKAWEK